MPSCDFGAMQHNRPVIVLAPLLALVLMLGNAIAHAQEIPEVTATSQPIRWQSSTQVIDPRWLEDANHPAKDGERRHVRQRTAAIIGAHTLAIGLYGATKWWDRGFSGRFRSADEGWFGRNTYAGGADKLGHFYINYVSTRLFARSFEWAGNSAEDSLALAAWTTAGTYAAIEVLDGLSKQWRFSKEDAVINLLGVGAALVLEKNPQLDRIIDLRLLYRKSAGQDSFDPFGDYSGQTYLIVAKAGGMPGLHDHPLLRYVEFAVGYNARDFSDTLSGPAGSRSRSFYAGISLNLSEVLGQTVFRNASASSGAKRATDTFLEFVQVPGTIALSRHRF